MSSPIITVENLSKSYILKHQNTERYTALRDVITNKAKSIFVPKSQNLNPASEEFWALKDVSFEVQQGDRIGIIGRNGAGKSTLLKILSRIVTPTKGRITIDGRLASLLEVGTGFHPELSGRENIFLNGSILGMTKSEIQKKFDEIVAFSEVEKFLDTPVKRYSSGMYVRLAFAVAAHLDPEILIVDEVLAVGDAEFQKKCLGKMKDVSSEGRTVLFVSHNMDAIMRLCNKSILLKSGTIAFQGDTEKAITSYLSDHFGTSSKKTWEQGKNAPGNDKVRLLEVAIHDENFKIDDKYNITSKIGITMKYLVLEDNEVFTHSFNLFNENGVHLFSSHDTTSDIRNNLRKKGEYSSTMWIPGNLLAEGTHSVSAAIMKLSPFDIYFHEMDAVAFTVYDPISGNSARGDYMQHFPGVMRPLMQWETKQK